MPASSSSTPSDLYAYSLKPGAPNNADYALLLTDHSLVQRDIHRTVSVLFLSNQVETRGAPTRVPIRAYPEGGLRLPNAHLFAVADVIFPLPLTLLGPNLGALHPDDAEQVRAAVRMWLGL